jgi:hypothetical protein
MSRNKKDQRGGHKRRRNGTYSCGCCAVLTPNHQSQNRTERDQAAARYEQRANESSAA